MHDVIVPKLNNNDATYTLIEWLFEDGAVVRRGDPLVVLETSKAASEVLCEWDGVLHRAVAELAECAHGQSVGRIFATEEERQAFLAARDSTVDTETLVITDSARELAAELGIGEERLRALGRSVVRRGDVETLAAEPTRPTQELSRLQRGVAAVVTESHRDIPAAFAVVRVEVDAALRAARAEAKRTGTLIGLPELVIKAVAARLEAFPLFFATPVDAGRVRLAGGAHVGVTVDVGTGLFVPVVRSAETRSAAEIADTMLDFRTRAMSATFEPADLAGATIMVSLHADADVVMAAPIVHPGQTCVICLAGTQHELILDDLGEVAARRIVHLTICYDHRVVNGKDAVGFLKAVKADLESA